MAYLQLQGLYFRRWNNPATRDTNYYSSSLGFPGVLSMKRGWKSRPRWVFENGLIASRLRSGFGREFTALSRYRADTIEAENKQRKSASWLKVLSLERIQLITNLRNRDIRYPNAVYPVRFNVSRYIRWFRNNVVIIEIKKNNWYRWWRGEVDVIQKYRYRTQF